VGIGIGGKHIYEDADFKGYESKLVFSKTDEGMTVKMQLSPLIDFSVQAGGGLSYNVGSCKLLVEGRYGRGLRPVKNQSLLDNRIYRYKEFKNRFLLFNAGIAIPIK
jgi:hypothetical protein